MYIYFIAVAASKSSTSLGFNSVWQNDGAATGDAVGIQDRGRGGSILRE
jgi:hypothetical protein